MRMLTEVTMLFKLHRNYPHNCRPQNDTSSTVATLFHNEFAQGCAVVYLTHNIACFTSTGPMIVEQNKYPLLSGSPHRSVNK